LCERRKQQNDIFERYKLSSLEEQDEGLSICKGILEADVLHCDARGYERRSVGGTSSTSLVDDNVLNHIIDETRAHTLWQKLEELYARKEGAKKMFLIKKLMRLRYKEDTPISHHVNEFQGIINQLSSMGITFEDKVRALLLLGSLPDTWETFKVTMCNSTPNGVVTWNLVKTKVLNEESKKMLIRTTLPHTQSW
jgi:hypothetical protein